MRINLEQMCIYDKVAKYVIEVKCREPLHIGTGSGENGDVLIHPEENRPFVPATGIAGAFREYYQYDEELQNRLFGAAEGESFTEGSRVFFSDGFFGESAVYTEVRPRIHMDGRTGTGQLTRTKGSDKKSGQKFVMESVAAGSRFSFSIYLYLIGGPSRRDMRSRVPGRVYFSSTPEKAGEKEKDLEAEIEHGLFALHQGNIQLGGQKSNGCGYVDLVSVKKAVYDFYDRQDRAMWAEESKVMEELFPERLMLGKAEGERIHYELSGQSEGGILVKSIAVTEYGENVPDAMNIRNHQREYILPASSVKGVLRNQIEKIAVYRKMPGVVNDLFGQKSDENQKGQAGKIRCFDSVIGNAQMNDEAKIQSRIHIDKFTGGVMYGGLFSEKPVYGKLTVRVDLEKGSDKESGLILMALRDLAMGIVPVGSGSSIGRGYLRGENITVKKGEQILAEIDCREGRIINGSSYIEQCLNALGQIGEE